MRFHSPPIRPTKAPEMLIHASCAARDGHGVLLTGPSGSGKSDLLLRLLEIGFTLVADDQVEVLGRQASAPARLAGLLEVRGLGILRLPFAGQATLVLAVALGRGERLPQPQRHALGLPLVMIDPALPSAPARVRVAFECALGRVEQVAGAFA